MDPPRPAPRRCPVAPKGASAVSPHGDTEGARLSMRAAAAPGASGSGLDTITPHSYCGAWSVVGMSTDFLFSMPSILTGASRVLDLAGQFDRYNESATVEEADGRALLCDLVVTARDLRTVAEGPPVEEEATE